MFARAAAVEAVHSPLTSIFANSFIGELSSELQSKIPTGDVRVAVFASCERHKLPPQSAKGRVVVLEPCGLPQRFLFLPYDVNDFF